MSFAAAKAKAKAKGKAKSKKGNPSGGPGAVALHHAPGIADIREPREPPKSPKKPEPKPKGKDPELEALEIRRKVMVMGGKWRERVANANTEVTVALEQAHGFPECQELLGFL